MNDVRLSVDGELHGRLRLGLVAASPVEVGPSSAALIEETERTCEDLRAALAGLQPSEIDGLRPARELYKSFGIDPTKTRPSSEALLRRVLREKPMPRILNAVDLCNLLALEFLLPMGLYDVAKINGAVLLRAGRAGESFAGIRKDDVHLEGRPVLLDEAGPFGNPTSDSLRTCVETATKALWMVIFAPASFPAEKLGAHVETAQRKMERHLVGPHRPVHCTGETWE
jgi:DNA/RNA-binding domain of Phe-tRNA-synthetase-like protein